MLELGNGLGLRLMQRRPAAGYSRTMPRGIVLADRLQRVTPRCTPPRRFRAPALLVRGARRGTGITDEPGTILGHAWGTNLDRIAVMPRIAGLEGWALLGSNQ